MHDTIFSDNWMWYQTLEFIYLSRLWLVSVSIPWYCFMHITFKAVQKNQYLHKQIDLMKHIIDEATSQNWSSVSWYVQLVLTNREWQLVAILWMRSSPRINAKQHIRYSSWPMKKTSSWTQIKTRNASAKTCIVRQIHSQKRVKRDNF